MKKPQSLIPVLISLFMCANAFGQQSLDKEHISDAYSIMKSGDCDAASRQLSFVSTQGKSGADYILCKAKVWECLHVYDSAVVYYNSYITLNGPDDSIQHHIAYLKSDDRQKESKSYKSVNYRMKNGLCISHRFWQVELKDALFLSPHNAPFQYAIDFAINSAHPIEHTPFLWQLSLGLNTFNNADRAYFLKLSGLTNSNSKVTSVGTSYEVTFAGSGHYLLINTLKHAVTVGPELGIGLLKMPAIYLLNAGDEGDIPYYASVFMGANCSAYIGKWLTFSIAYRHYINRETESSKMHATPSSNPTITNFPINIDNIKFAIGVRI